MKISGEITINHNEQDQIIQEDDFTIDEHLDGTSTSFGFGTGDYSVEIIVENINGALSQGDWETKNCTIVQDGTSFSL